MRQRNDIKQTLKEDEIDGVLDDLERGTMGIDEACDICWGEVKSAYRLARFLKETDRSDEDTVERLMQHALTLGCEDAGWEILEAPEKEGEVLDRVIGRLRALGELVDIDVVMIRNGNRFERRVQDDRMMEEARTRAIEHPEIAAAVIVDGRTKDVEDLLA